MKHVSAFTCAGRPGGLSELPPLYIPSSAFTCAGGPGGPRSGKSSAMSWATGLMVYLVIWWTVLFAVLPLGVRRVEKPGTGQDRGAPARPDLVRKAIITSIVAAVLWIGFYFLHQADIFS